MTASPTFSWHTISGFLQGAVSQGHDRSSLLSASGIKPSLFSLDSRQTELTDTVYDGGTVHLSQLLRLWQTLCVKLEDVSLGFLEEPTKIAMKAELCRVLSRCYRLDEGIARAFDFLMVVRNDRT